MGLRSDAPALALRGIAMAQLGDFARARALLRAAARGFGPKEAVARARCAVAEAEIALASRELDWPARSLEAARLTLESHGDAANAAHARILEIRRLLLLGKLYEAERRLLDDPASLPPALRAVHELARAGICMRRLQAGAARGALDRAATAAKAAGIPALAAEVANALDSLNAPAARRVEDGAERPLRLDDVEALLATNALVVDANRHVVRERATVIPLARRPVLFALARALAEAGAAGVPRGELIRRTFRIRQADETHRARLRVEIGRLRKLLARLATVEATDTGFVLAPRGARAVVVLARPVDERHAAVLALLADGEAWSSSALALALGASQRNVQRALDDLAATGKAHALGRGRARRWTMPPLPGFTTSLLLPAPIPGD